MFAPLFVLCITFWGLTAWSAPVETRPTAVDIVWDLQILMRDGVKLHAVMYKPVNSNGRLPAVFVKTPYLSDRRLYHEWATYFAQNGYAAVTVDARGRGESEGIFRPLDGDGRDGYDVVEWLAKQPWCNGRVGTFGGSYDGYGQWATIKELPPHLRTAVPTASVGPGIDFPMGNNVFSPYAIRWLTYVSGKTLKAATFNDSLFWLARYVDVSKNHLPFRLLNKAMGNPAPIFEEWVSHPTYDAYWREKVPGKREYQRINFPILTITGHFDGDQFGALHYYRSHMREGSPAARARHYLVIGPWDHSGTRRPAKETFGRKFSDKSMIDIKKLHRDWFDWTLKGKAKPKFLKQRVAFYDVGPEEWRYAPTLEAATEDHRTLYLDSRIATPNDVFDAGILAEKEAASADPDRCTFNPLISPSLDPANRQSPIEPYKAASDRLVYYSEPFDHPVVLRGSPKLIAWIALDVPDTDFEVTLSEVMTDGSSPSLSHTPPLRARYRDSLQEEKLAEAHQVNRYRFDFSFTAIEIAKGSRLRLTIQAPSPLGRERNYNAGGVVADETEKDARPAHVMLYHDKAHPSFLELPLGKPIKRTTKVAPGP